MNFFLSRPKNLFRQIWFWFLVLITFNQIAILFAYYLFIVQPTASSLTTVLMGLADAVERQQLQGGSRGLDVLKDQWISNDNIMVIQGLPAKLEPKPGYPALRLIEDKIHAGWGDRVRFGYSSTPDRILWLMFTSEKKPFSIGVPLSYRLQTQVVGLLVVGLIFLLTIVAAWFVSSRLNRPLRDLSVAARKMGSGEELSEIILGRPAPLEVIDLAYSLKEMRSQIQKMQLERDRFLAGIAHDLRTPLSRMRVAVELPEISNTSLALGLQEDIEDMRAILDQFLELSKLDAERSEPFIIGDIGVLVNEIGAKYIRAAAPVFLKVKKVPAISYKPIALTRLMYNLIDNSLRHGGGGVLVDVDSDKDNIWISVGNLSSDHAQESAIIQAIRWTHGGQQSGLGSAIIRRISDVHGATLEISSENHEFFKVTVMFRKNSQINIAP